MVTTSFVTSVIKLIICVRHHYEISCSQCLRSDENREKTARVYDRYALPGHMKKTKLFA